MTPRPSPLAAIRRFVVQMREDQKALRPSKDDLIGIGIEAAFDAVLREIDRLEKGKKR